MRFISEIPGWLWFFGGIVVVIVVFALARLPGRASIAGSLPSGDERPDITPDGGDEPRA
jgi:hypothetical protein